MSLDEAKYGERVIVTDIADGYTGKKRLRELGVAEGCEICPLFSGISGGIRAYLIKGCVLAVRDCDARGITVVGC